MSKPLSGVSTHPFTWYFWCRRLWILDVLPFYFASNYLIDLGSLGKFWECPCSH